MNLTKKQIEMISYLADERKLEVKIYNYKGVLSVELHENTRYSLEDRFNLILADGVKTLKECKQISNKFINWLDEEYGGQYGYNIHAQYVAL
jgi:hypothetical protein